MRPSKLQRLELECGHPYRVDPEWKELPRSVPPSTLRRVVGVIAAVGALGIIGGSLSPDAEPMKQRWTFLNASTSLSDLGLSASAESAGPWALEQHREATGAWALVNRAGEEEARPATIVTRSLWGRDLTAVTRCKTDPIRSAQQCGLVFRFRDEANYDVVRLETVGKAAVLGAVVAGRETELARATADAESNTWQELRVQASAGVIRVSVNGRQLIEVPEGVPAMSGRVGLWAPAAGVAYFDELLIEGLPDAPRALEVLPLLGRSRS